MRPRKEVGMLKSKYLVGTKIKLISMDDPQTIPVGTIGVVEFVDDDGQIHMKWDNGRSLALIYGVDQFEIIQ